MEDSTISAYSSFKTVLAYCVFILASPITTFFFSKLVLFEGIIGASPIATNVWSAIFAVIMLHIALGLYIYKAYFGTEKGKPVEKID
ncbi:vacuolar ATPase assembly integral membrane protein VMA21 homolog [Leptinotarsa decemlineata]|uniref:vacuolar ATPase assembly integral membrane protein VMA21 homolog n=1 Tax=Leptinotarsa decemlineata TaxID=7539 RepID=UPI000C252976|nr:vacuolar ATPase assembly integral membrane protein VMA21 homolog [Leptinotarsa decemlineata]